MPHIPRVICMKDAVEMTIAQNGVTLEMSATWGSYYKISADKYECPSCEDAVLLPAPNVLREHFQDDYDQFTGVQIDFADKRRKEMEEQRQQKAEEDVRRIDAGLEPIGDL